LFNVTKPLRTSFVNKIFTALSTRAGLAQALSDSTLGALGGARARLPAPQQALDEERERS
jgi:hypothetical protein